MSYSDLKRRIRQICSIEPGWKFFYLVDSEDGGVTLESYPITGQAVIETKYGDDTETTLDFIVATGGDEGCWDDLETGKDLEHYMGTLVTGVRAIGPRRSEPPQEMIDECTKELKKQRRVEVSQ